MSRPLPILHQHPLEDVAELQAVVAGRAVLRPVPEGRPFAVDEADVLLMHQGVMRAVGQETANSLDDVPAPLIDRCRVITLPDPTPVHLELAAAGVIAERTADPDHADRLTTIVAEVLRQRRRAGRRTSLRQLSRIVARLEVAGSAPMLM